ncbi:MAG TPA: MSMEG_4193 family putative phosphomutase [Actinomycetes bacterium]|jgi:probable phosphoglycerate mutase|nr:MSMEG_4193 family putative phosphomutase [Actinomycetes bacterium]
MKRLLLLRHASTEQTGKRLSGWTPGVHLSEQGLREARALAGRLAPLEIHAVCSSPLERCVETAAAVAEPRGLKIETVEDVGEVRYGDWTGKELSELAKQELWRVVQLHPSGARFPEGESLLEMQTRAVLACERLRAAHAGQTVAVCSHADVIKAVTAHYLGMHLDLFQRLVVAPASVTAIGFGPVPCLLRLNSTGEQSDLRPPEKRKEGDDASA